MAMSESAAGTMSAAPNPWTARAATSSAGPWASPASSDETVKTVNPVVKTRRRPRWSVTRPPSSRKPPSTSP
jgi:hypothetical protein